MTCISYPIGVLIMAYGGPNELGELPGFLADNRAGRPTSQTNLEEITHDYRSIGGKSLLLEISRNQVDAVAQQLDPTNFRCYLGMHHWASWLEDVVGDMIEDGVTHDLGVISQQVVALNPG